MRKVPLDARLFDSLLEMELKRSFRYQHFTSMLLIEVFFKQRLEEGEQKLIDSRRLTNLVCEALRETDLVGANGGSGVAIGLLFSDETGMDKVANRLGNWIASCFSAGGPDSFIGISFGGACFPTHATDLRTLYDRAAEMLQESKGQGGGWVRITG